MNVPHQSAWTRTAPCHCIGDMPIDSSISLIPKSEFQHGSKTCHFLSTKWHSESSRFLTRWDSSPIWKQTALILLSQILCFDSCFFLYTSCVLNVPVGAFQLVSKQGLKLPFLPVSILHPIECPMIPVLSSLFSGVPWFLFLYLFIFIFYGYIYMPKGASVHCVQDPWRWEEGIGFPGTGVTDGSEPPCVCWESNPGSARPGGPFTWAISQASKVLCFGSME